ncbi:uncharacterized protein PV07_12871 [Cladophialophora immunda]|uniref:Uncharacterized protein n=1 Tax=Cladophialophora immunda TaxID=569365 RepID=A0A0D1Z202_9EURO|nr:uncharacterized protein PV07_12871 [Cladophialophora immunda]KIW21696.1 hypothetical protein PV07_12871 [Cladophialophora immunda]
MRRDNDGTLPVGHVPSRTWPSKSMGLVISCKHEGWIVGGFDAQDERGRPVVTTAFVVNGAGRHCRWYIDHKQLWFDPDLAASSGCECPASSTSKNELSCRYGCTVLWQGVRDEHGVDVRD